MYLTDLTHSEKFVLNFCREYPQIKFTGTSNRIMSTLAAYGLAIYAGNLQYELTTEGEELALEYNNQLDKLVVG